MITNGTHYLKNPSDLKGFFSKVFLLFEINKMLFIVKPIFHFFKYSLLAEHPQVIEILTCRVNYVSSFKKAKTYSNLSKTPTKP